MRYILFLLVFILGCAETYPKHIVDPHVKKPHIIWVDSRETAFSLPDNRPVILYFTAWYCKACRQFERNVLKDVEVINLINDKFYAVKIESSDESLLEEYGVDKFPTCLVLSSKGEVKILEFNNIMVEKFVLYIRIAAETNKMLQQLSPFGVINGSY